MWTNNRRKYAIFCCIVIVIGFIGGICFTYNNVFKPNQKIVLDCIKNWSININKIHINNILPHLMILSLFLVLSSFLIGTPLYIFYIFYNGFTIGFTISSLCKIYNFKGFIYSLIYILITKGLYLFLLLCFLTLLFRVGENIVFYLIKKTKPSNHEKTLKKATIFLFLIFINDIFIYFYGNKILAIFKFLIR